MFEMASVTKNRLADQHTPAAYVSHNKLGRNVTLTGINLQQ
jgi:hypothetical protein